MPTDDRPWTDADRETVAAALRPYLGHDDEAAYAVLDALTAAGWRPPPPEPDGIHWRTGGSVGCTIYNPYGDLAGMMRTPEAAAAVVATLNDHATTEEDHDAAS